VFENEKKIKLTDLINQKLLQQLQDTFAESMGFASLTYAEAEAMTEPSRFIDFCMKYTRGSELGNQRCKDCDLKWGKLAAEQGKPVIYVCHAGLTDFAVPIMVQGKHFGTIFGGQVLTEPPNEQHFRELARELGINEDEYVEAAKKIKIVSRKTIEAATNLLFLVGNSISEIANKNLELFKINEREALYRKLTETIRSSLDISEIKHLIVDIIGKTLNADRCFIVEFDQKSDKFKIVTDEYLSSSEIISYVGKDVNQDVPNFVEAIKKGKIIMVNNKEILLDTTNTNFEAEKN